MSRKDGIKHAYTRVREQVRFREEPLIFRPVPERTDPQARLLIATQLHPESRPSARLRLAACSYPASLPLGQPQTPATLHVSRQRSPCKGSRRPPTFSVLLLLRRHPHPQAKPRNGGFCSSPYPQSACAGHVLAAVHCQLRGPQSTTRAASRTIAGTSPTPL
jgi:hypothetical protein